VFVIGAVELKSNVTLHLAADAKLAGVADGLPSAISSMREFPGAGHFS
jgi:polygalacturonase